MISTGAGICLCEKDDGVFLVLKSAEDIVELKKLINKLIYLSPDGTDLFTMREEE